MAINLAFHDISRVIWWRIYRENGDLSRVISWSLDGDLLSLFDPWNWELGFFTLVHSYYVVGSPFKTLSQRSSLQQLTMVNHRKTIYSWFMIAKLVQITVLFLGFIKQLTYLGGPHGMAIWMGYHQTWRFQLRKWKGKCTYIFGWFIIFLVYIFNGIFRILNWRYLPLPTIYKAYVRPMTM